jgi:hypothetical protein
VLLLKRAPQDGRRAGSARTPSALTALDCVVQVCGVLCGSQSFPSWLIVSNAEVVNKDPCASCLPCAAII